MSKTDSLKIFEPSEEDIGMLLQACCHLGSKTVETRMEPYVWQRRNDGVNIINFNQTWQKLVLAARIIATIHNPADVCVISSRPFGHRAVLKFAAHTGATAIAGRITPGNFTNYITRSFKEPRLIITTDPRTDAQAIAESSYVNIPVISLADLDSPVEFVDVVIPTNNRGRHAIGLIWYLLAREVLRLRGTISRNQEWNVMPDLYFYRDPEEEREKEENEELEALDTEAAGPNAFGQNTTDWDVAADGAISVEPSVEQWGTSDWTTGAVQVNAE